jgi:hypothetical protein
LSTIPKSIANSSMAKTETMLIVPCWSPCRREANLLVY